MGGPGVGCGSVFQMQQSPSRGTRFLLFPSQGAAFGTHSPMG